MRIQFLLTRERFTAAEDRTVRITVRNEGTSPVELADPFRDSDDTLTYTLTGPEYPEGRDITWRTFALSNPEYSASPLPAPRVRLGPGQAIESTLALHEWLPATRPGRYRLIARLTQPSFTVTSPPVEFDLVASSAGPASLGCDVAAPFGSGVMATWLQDVAGQQLLMVGGYEDASDDESEGVRRNPATVLGPVEQGSSEALSPWSNDPLGHASVTWLVWRKGASVMALAEPASTQHPFRFELDAPPEHLVRPPLQTASGELFIPVVTAGGRELRLIRFQSSADATQTTPGEEVGRVRLPGMPVASRATLQPASLGNGISVILVEESPGGLDLHHVRTHAGGRLTRVASTLLRGLRAIPRSEPGLWIDAAGRLNAALVAASMKNPRRAVLAEVRYRADGRPEAPARMTPLGELPSPPRAAVARHHSELRRGGELFWAILLEDGRLLSRRSSSGGPMTPRHPVAVPLELYPARDAYILTVDPALGPSFEPLR